MVRDIPCRYYTITFPSNFDRFTGKNGSANIIYFENYDNDIWNHNLPRLNLPQYTLFFTVMNRQNKTLAS